MAVCPLPDAHIESLLRNIRSELLFDIQENKPSTEILAFQSALALNASLMNIFTVKQKKNMRLSEA